MFASKVFKKLFLLSFLLVFTLALWGCGSSNKDDVSEDIIEEELALDELEVEQVEEEEVEAATTSDFDVEKFASSINVDKLELHYEMKFTGFNEDYMTSKVWIKDGRTRTESNFEGENSIIIDTEDETYILRPDEKIAFILSYDDYEDEIFDDELLDDNFVDYDYLMDMTYLRTEKVNGHTCHVFLDETLKDEGMISTLWIHKDYGIPMKIETTSQWDNESYVMEIIKLEAGRISNDLFVVPSDYTIMDMWDLEY